jgi:two-component system NtrC family sensor kinase
LASIPEGVTDMKSVADERAKQDLTFLLDEIPQAIGQSLDGVAQVSRIVLAMKEFSHPSTKERQIIDVNKVIERATIVCRGEWKNVASLNLQLDPRLPKISGFEGELNQVILNMVVNAAHAIDKRGVLPGEITVRTAPDDDGIAITIEDTGSGIPDSIRSRIFEPFFTTKPVGQGTGQGLAICRDVIVNKHGGRIDIIRTNGNGTAFRLYLPVSGEGMDSPSPGKSADILDFQSARA